MSKKIFLSTLSATVLMMSATSCFTYKSNDSVDMQSDKTEKREEKAIQTLIDSGEDVYYASMDDFSFENVNESTYQYSMELFTDPEMTSAADGLNILATKHELWKGEYYEEWEYLGSEYYFEDVSYLEFQDDKLITSAYGNSDVSIPYEITSTNKPSLSQYSTQGSEYDLIYVSDPSTTEEYWLALDIKDNVEISDSNYLARFYGEYGNFNIEFDKDYETVLSMSDESGGQLIDFVINQNYYGNIYDYSYLEDKGVNYITETYWWGGFNKSDSMVFNYWDNSINWRWFGLKKISINSSEQIWDSSITEHETLVSKYSVLEDFIINEYGSEYLNLFVNLNYDEDYDSTKYLIEIDSELMDDGTHSTTIYFDWDDYVYEHGSWRFNSYSTNLLSNRFKEIEEFDYDNSYLTIFAKDMSGTSYDKNISYDYEMENFDKYVPTSKKIYIWYIVILSLLSVGLLVLYIVRRLR